MPTRLLSGWGFAEKCLPDNRFSDEGVQKNSVYSTITRIRSLNRQNQP